ncbi:MAG: alpha/beta hydrolase [Elsteraceae bacterium]
MRINPNGAPPRALILSVCAFLSIGAPSVAAGGRGAAIEPPQRVLALSPTEVNALATAGKVERLAGSARCAVESQRILYRTIGGAGEPVTASAAVLVPRGQGAACEGPRPLVMYARGTSFRRDADISLLEVSEPDAVVAAAFFAAQGYVVVAPNYVGYAGSTADYHPYYQLEAQAADVIDALSAARSSAPSMRLPPQSGLFLVGYSQGGAVALAAQRALERPDAPPGFAPTAVAASAGATMIGEMARTVFAGEPSVGATGFLPLLVASYQRAYPGVPSAAEIYAPPFNAPGGLPPLPGALGYMQLLAQGKLPLNLFDRQDGKPFLVSAAFRARFNSDPANPLQRAFDANNLNDFKPEAPLMMCHGGRDLLVPIANTETTARAFAAKGAHVTRIDLEDSAEPLALAFQKTLDAATTTPQARAAAYHFVGMPFCNAAARAFFDRLSKR